jgi:hypothetical protein
MRKRFPAVLLAITAFSVALVAQTSGQAASLARSQDETVSLGYMHTVAYSQRQYKKKYEHYATTLAELVHTGSFTKRMAATDRGAYTVEFHGKPDAYSLTMVPKQFDSEHRSFYADETAKIHVEEDKPATAESPPLK